MTAQPLPELVEAITHTLRYCEVRPEEGVVIYSDSGRPKEIGELFVSAAVVLGCDPILVWVRGRPPLSLPPRTAIEAMKHADIVFDVTTES